LGRRGRRAAEAAGAIDRTGPDGHRHGDGNPYARVNLDRPGTERAARAAAVDAGLDAHPGTDRHPRTHAGAVDAQPGADSRTDRRTHAGAVHAQLGADSRADGHTHGQGFSE
jgi:hypothetical protein